MTLKTKIWQPLALCFIFFSIFLGLPSQAHAGRTFYVAVSGHDTGPGTAKQPWRTLGRAAAAVAPGDVVRVG
ncbi:MAG TPA: hypothetical protein VE082_02175, partial [Desulfobaccales bacterium]|nr:hypothetical protein [Desulfobaccales bacterium]